MPPKRASRKPPRAISAYRLFFLYIEPISALAGAISAYFTPYTYLKLTHSGSTPTLGAFAVQLASQTVLAQLANLYLLFALNEALVLRATSDRRVWNALLTALLIADFGHLWSVRAVGNAVEVYLAFWNWNVMGWGNVGFVYAGIAFRVAYLMRLGLNA